ncbi:MAG TPA: hypothetical protein VJ762_06860 [Sphingobium sp.]|nr:hypothetical protein [Sphingobium sp.]
MQRLVLLQGDSQERLDNLSGHGRPHHGPEVTKGAEKALEGFTLLR